MSKYRVVIVLSLVAPLTVGGLTEEYREDNGLWPVERGGKWGLINEQGEMIVEPSSSFVRPDPIEGWYHAYQGGKEGIIDKDGVFVIPPSIRRNRAFLGGTSVCSFRRQVRFYKPRRQDNRGARIREYGSVQRGYVRRTKK